MPRRSSGSPPSSSRPRPPTTSAMSRSAGARCSTSPAGCRSQTGSRPCARARARRRRAPAPSSGSSARPSARTTPAANVVLAETAARFRDEGLTGWDLAGPEAAFPDPLDHAAAFEAARAGGLRITIHAGEWGGAAQVRRALALDPERIAHGPGAIDDPDLCAELIARGVTLDLCPTSNWQAGIVASLAAHPLARLHRAGRAGHAQHGRHDGLRHHAVRRVRPRGRADRADAARAVGDRPARARCRLRRRGRPRAAASANSIDRGRSVNTRFTKRSRSGRGPTPVRGSP